MQLPACGAGLFAILCLAIVAPGARGEDVAGSPMSQQTGSMQTLLANRPATATAWAPSLIQALEAYQSVQQAEAALKQLRVERDAIKTELVAVNGTVQLVGEERQQAEAKLRAAEQQRQERVNAMRREFEVRLNEEIGKAREQITKEMEAQFAKQVQDFESRQQELIEESLTQELQLKEREIDSLSREIESLTNELRDRLARLHPDSELAQSMQRSIGETINQQRAQLQAKRQQLKVQRDDILAKRRAEYVDRLRKQQVAELQTRLMYKEATLRQAMADLLGKSQKREEDSYSQAKKTFDEVKQRHADITQRQALLATKLQAMEQQIAETGRRLEQHQASRGSSLAKLEQSFRKSSSMGADDLTWFGQVVKQSPPELASELGMIYQRLVLKAEQDRQVQEQQRMLRERELAMQVSHEMERRYQQEQAQRQRVAEAANRKFDEAMNRAKTLQHNGLYDEALRVLATIQTSNPSQANQIALMQQDLQSAKDEATRQAKASQVQRLYNDAMKSFQQGRYEEAVGLFERVIEADAGLERAAH